MINSSRPKVRFLYNEHSVGDRPLVTDLMGSIREDDYPVRPYGSQGQIPFILTDSSNTYESDYLCKFKNVIESDIELDKAKSKHPKIADVVHLWNRFSHPVNDPLELQSWVYNVTQHQFMSSIKSNNYIGIVSHTLHENYSLKVSVSSSTSTPGLVGIVIARIVKEGKDYTLSVIRSCFDTEYSYALVYNMNQADEKILLNSKDFILDKIWANQPNGTLIQVVRTGTHIKTYISDIIDPTQINSSSLFEFDLALTPETKKFIGFQSVGMACLGQDNISFKIQEFIDYNNVLIDIRDHKVYYYDHGPELWFDDVRTVMDNDVAGVGRFIYSEDYDRMYYVRSDGRLTRILGTSSASATYIEGVAAEVIRKHQLCHVRADGKFAVATINGNKAAGYALEDYDIGATARLIPTGVLSGYIRKNMIPGDVYYQGDSGEIIPMDDTKSIKYPAALAVSPTELIILNEVDIGSSKGGPAGLLIQGINVVRDEHKFEDNTATEVQVCSVHSLLDEIFEYTPDWDVVPYILKQSVKLKNFSVTNLLTFRFLDTATQSSVYGTLLPGMETVFSPLSINWVLFVEGDYKLTTLLSVLSGKLPFIVVPQQQVDPSWNTYDFYGEDGTAYSVVFGRVKRFEIPVLLDNLSVETIIFNTPQWIEDNILSHNYMLLGSLVLKNITGDETTHITVTTVDMGTIVSEFDILPGEQTVIQVSREDTVVKGIGGQLQGNVSLQAVSYIFTD